MTTPLTNTAGGGALREALAKAVPAWIDVLAGMPKLTMAVLRGQADAALAEAQATLDEGDASWETRGMFLALARSLALDAYRPGGVTYLGMHWEATRDAPGKAETVTPQGGAL